MMYLVPCNKIVLGSDICIYFRETITERSTWYEIELTPRVLRYNYGSNCKRKPYIQGFNMMINHNQLDFSTFYSF